MPNAAPHICPQPGCNTLVLAKGKCGEHKTASSWGDDKVRGNRHQRGYGTKWDKTRKRILKRDHYLCQEDLKDGKYTPATEVDHVVPRAWGGSEDDDNLQAISEARHKIKTARESKG